MGKHKPEMTNDEYISALNTECQKKQWRELCDSECMYIGWCKDVYAAFWAARDNEPVCLVRGGEDG